MTECVFFGATYCVRCGGERNAHADPTPEIRKEKQ